MSIQAFWTNVNRAAGWRAPRVSHASGEGESLRLQRILANADLWLATAAVDGFDQQDFIFLAEPERLKLADAVDRFHKIVRDVPPNRPATRAQSDHARAALADILAVLRPDLYADAEAFQIGKQVEQATREMLPDWVKSFQFETGEDATGEKALWVWVECSDSAFAGAHLPKFFTVKATIEQAVRAVAPAYWPYVRFRSSSEQRAARRRTA